VLAILHLASPGPSRRVVNAADLILPRRIHEASVAKCYAGP
jgi:hypothetical protein